ncbi:MAG: 50S ribosomal protein L24 [Elusimicrobia bacterium RIFOXYC2_FULL_34_12]|nr:MAG: 50S ribosomal protein L24 [Elusimicrobia bacterium RIFOXYC2_FULL_34_12]OGS38578.1 MAG: 50S ribosomal protein L24 [Elusimicrobia bacterium RIFOXYD2_FULL_34_30]HAM38847.1 50S ribosomal protein L24 [Elusimicrobiota bacterium]
MNIKKKDKVVILSGKDKGKRGEVLKIFIDNNTAIVSKVNFVKRHTKPTQTDPGGIREKESPLSVSKLMLVCPKCDKAMRPKWEILQDGTKSRICRKCGEMIV